MADSDNLKSPRDWAKVTGIEILDADGWRGRNGREFTDRISEEEFRYRASISTIRARGPVWRESPSEALENVMEEEGTEISLPSDEDSGDES